MNNQFTFTFKGKNAEELAENLSAFFWEGGLDQYIERNFLEDYNLSLDDVEFEKHSVIINTDNAKI